MQLEWQTEGDHLIAYGIVRGYRIKHVPHDGYRVTVDNFPIGTRRKLDDAKTLAQQHNDR